MAPLVRLVCRPSNWRAMALLTERGRELCYTDQALNRCVDYGKRINVEILTSDENPKICSGVIVTSCFFL